MWLFMVIIILKPKKLTNLKKYTGFLIEVSSMSNGQVTDAPGFISVLGSIPPKLRIYITKIGIKPDISSLQKWNRNCTVTKKREVVRKQFKFFFRILTFKRTSSLWLLKQTSSHQCEHSWSI